MKDVYGDFHKSKKEALWIILGLSAVIVIAAGAIFLISPGG